MLWSNTSIQTKKTNRNGQEIGILQLLKMADHHNVIVSGKKKSNKTLYISFLSIFKLNCSSLFCSTIWGGKKRGRDCLQLCKKLLVFKTNGNCCCDKLFFCLNELQRERSFCSTWETSCHSVLSRWELCSRVLDVPLAKGKIYFLRDERKMAERQDQEGRISRSCYKTQVPNIYTNYLSTQKHLEDWISIISFEPVSLQELARKFGENAPYSPDGAKLPLWSATSMCSETESFMSPCWVV